MNSATIQTTGVVLAGGRSSRMGHDKALLAVQGQTLLERAYRLLARVGCDPVVVSGRYEGYTCVTDPGQGPLVGIAAVLGACRSAQLLILPVDMPYLGERQLQRLLDAAPEVSHGVSYAEAQFPLLLKPNPQLLAGLTALLAEGTDPCDHSIHGFYQRMGIHLLPIAAAERGCFDNTNTPEQWRDCVTRLEKDASS